MLETLGIQTHSATDPSSVSFRMLLLRYDFVILYHIVTLVNAVPSPVPLLLSKMATKLSKNR